MNSNSQDNVYAAPSAAPGPLQTIEGAGWSKFWGIMTLIGGALFSITIIGAVIGIPYILAGLAAIRAADEIGRYNSTRDPAASVRAASEYARHFKIMAILTIVTLALYIVGVAVALVLGLTTAANS